MTSPTQENLSSLRPSSATADDALAAGTFAPAAGTELAGARVISGTGEDLGAVVGIQADRHGNPKWIAFVEDPDAPAAVRLAPLKFVKGYAQGEVRLKGPREGYHITRVLS